jgi:hypothetical protein
VSQALQSLRCCLNPKVLIGLAAAGLAVVLLAPNLIAGAFPLLLALVCPLSMLVMMGSMARMGTKKENEQTSAPHVATSGEAPLPTLGVSADARLALLRAQQQVLAEQSAAMAAEIAALDAAETQAQPPSRALRQAERVAALADSSSAR